MNCGSNLKEVKVAREYKYLLSNIRPLIEQLDKAKDAQLCLLWLSKLDQCSRHEECERNEILSELSRQVRNKRLEPPFNSQPPPGPLKSIPVKETTETSPRSPFSSFSSRSRVDEAQWKSRFLDCCKPGKEDHAKCLALQQTYHERVLNDQLIISRYQEIIRSLIRQKLKNNASAKLKSLRSSYEGKVSDLTSSLKAAEEENASLRQKMAASAVPKERLHELEARNKELKEKLGRLEITNNILELKCRELEREKELAVSQLESKLEDSEKRLKEAGNHVRALERKHDEAFRACKSEHQTEISELEKKYTCELSTLERILEEKQTEIGNLREQVSTQGLHFEAEVLRLKHDVLHNPDLDKEKRKVKFLKSKINKLEKGQESMAVAFQSQLEQIVAKKDLLISTLELKLNSKNAVSTVGVAVPGLDNVITEKVCFLETQYRKLLEESESQASQRRQMDLEKILTLEKQLVNHGVGVQDLNLTAYPENLMLTGPCQPSEPVPYSERSQQNLC